jgi:hypothetical protein
VVAVHVETRRVQHTDNVLQIRIGQIAAGNDQVYVLKALTDISAVNGIDDPITDGEDSHTYSFTHSRS